MDRGVLAAVRRFPQKSLEIRRLAIADSAFRSLCGDFGEAEDALARWSHTPSEQAASRQSEYSILVEELASEISAIVEDRLRAEDAER
jgi:hypothetical protein